MPSAEKQQRRRKSWPIVARIVVVGGEGVETFHLLEAATGRNVNSMAIPRVSSGGF